MEDVNPSVEVGYTNSVSDSDGASGLCALTEGTVSALCGGLIDYTALSLSACNPWPLPLANV